jgi:mRNA-degrading endonuclease RelE of RelBE toxin-antitoxin system
MEFIETSIFTKQVQEQLSDEEYKEFQEALIINPAAGDIIRGSGGLRKIRWSVGSSGKRGGVRVIYYWQTKENLIFLLLMYRKNVKENLSPKELKILRKLMETF